MARWLATNLPEWLVGLVLLGGLPALMALVQTLLYRRLPHWRRGAHNDAGAIIVPTAALVYSVAVAFVVITLWDRYEEINTAHEEEATNLVALVHGSEVFDASISAQVRAQVLKYNEDVVAGWDGRIGGADTPQAHSDLDQLMATVRDLEPRTQAQTAYVDDAVQRLTRAVELRQRSLRLVGDEQLPGILWFAVMGGSVIVLGLCLTCGIDDGALRHILLIGVTMSIAINILLVIELNYPYHGDFAVGPESFEHAAAELRQMG